MPFTCCYVYKNKYVIHLTYFRESVAIKVVYKDTMEEYFSTFYYDMIGVFRYNAPCMFENFFGERRLPLTYEVSDDKDKEFTRLYFKMFKNKILMKEVMIALAQKVH